MLPVWLHNPASLSVAYWLPEHTYAENAGAIGAPPQAKGESSPLSMLEAHVDGLTVVWRKKEAWVETRRAVLSDGVERELEVRVLRFADGVEAKFGNTTIRCKSLEVREDLASGSALAEGDVELTDPDGVVKCNSLVFDWKLRTGSAKAASIRIGALQADCDEVRLYPDKWVLIGVRLDPDVDGSNIYGLSAKEIELWPGTSGVARKLGISLFGKRTVVVPRYGFSLRGGGEGLRLPGFSRQETGEFGVAWDSDFALSRRLSAFANAEVLQDSQPRTALTITYSMSDLPRGAVGVPPRSSFSDPFPFGYLDNVSVRDPQREFAATGLEHQLLYVGASFRQRISGREDFAQASKPLEVGLDLGRLSGPTAYRFQIRYENVRGESGFAAERFGLTAGATVRPFELWGGLRSLIRVDGSLIGGDRHPYGWARSLFGLEAQVAPWLTLSAGVSATLTTGKPFFAFDEPWPKRAVHWRANLKTGPRELSLLAKTDPRTGRVLDREVAFRQIAGSLEPYVVWREHPSRFVVGIELRTLDVLARITKRLRAPQ